VMVKPLGSEDMAVYYRRVPRDQAQTSAAQPG
jgi:hypothetical protein